MSSRQSPSTTQNNACIKSDGGAIGLIDNPSALWLWIVAGPEVVALIEDFEDADSSWGNEMRCSTMTSQQASKMHLGKISAHSST